MLHTKRFNNTRMSYPWSLTISSRDLKMKNEHNERIYTAINEE